jgi:hypothetical protein
VTQRDAVRAQLVLERGAVHARLDARRSRCTVDVQHLIEVAQVDSDRAAVRVADVALHPAHHRRAAAVGNRGRTGLGAPVEDVRHLGLGARGGHGVGRVGVLAPQGAHHVPERLSVRVPGALGGVRRALRRQGGRGREPGLGQIELVDRGRIRHRDLVEVEHAGQGLGHLLLLVPGRALALVPPAPELAAARRHRRQGRPLDSTRSLFDTPNNVSYSDA